MPAPHLPEGFDFLDPDRNVVRLPVDELAELRRIAPVWWCEQKIGKGGFNDGGYWVVTKHKDVKEVSRRNDIYHAGPNTALPQFADEMTREDIDIVLSLDEAIAAARRVGARRTLFVHMSHDIEHDSVSATLPAGIELAYDGLVVPVPSAPG